MTNLPAIPRKHFNLKVNDNTERTILDFCENALLIPRGHLTQYERMSDYDSYYVYVRSGYRFVVSSQELVQWEARRDNPHCIPGRDEMVYDQ